MIQLKVPATKVLVHWSFNEGAGLTAADDSGNGNDGQLSGGTNWSTYAVRHHGVSFDGVDDRVSHGHETSSTWESTTVALWVKNGEKWPVHLQLSLL